MNKALFLGATALRSAATLGISLALANPAWAQEAVPAPTQTPAEDEAASPDPAATLQGEVETESGENVTGSQEVVVTGSRIRRPNLESAVPVTSIAGEAFFERGDLNVGDALNDLPQLRNTRQQNNSNLAVGVAGLNLLDLRGLGTVRTLVLVNGRRHVASDITSTASSVDVNSIPSDLIERVDIVTGGSSAVYGSNAIAGVVNFVLRRNFEGIQVRGHGGMAQEGYGKNGYLSAMAGTNFGGDDRGNVVLHGEYYRHERVYGEEVPHLRRNDGLFVTDVDGSQCTSISPRIPATCDPNVVFGSDGVPDRTYLRDVRSTTINPFGLVSINQRPLDADCGTGINSGTGPLFAGSPYSCSFLFQPDGTLVPQTGTRFGSGILGGAIGGNGSTQREDRLVTVYPENKRFNVNLLAYYTVSEAFEPFVEAKFVRVNSNGGNAGPTGIQGTRVQFDTRERVRLDNPFLSAANRTFIANAILESNCNSDLQVTCPNTTNIGTTAAPVLIPGNLLAAQRNQIVAGTYRFPIARNILDIGPRDELFERDTFRIVGGFRGNFNDDWNYEVSVNYGRMDEEVTRTGYVDRQRFMLSLDAGRNPTNGQIQCRAQFDPASAFAFDIPGTSLTDAQRQLFKDRLAADIAACVPYNPFGASDNSAAGAYFERNVTDTNRLEQFQASAFVSGDSSQLFELPGGPVGFATGVELRIDSARYNQDDFTTTGGTNAVAIGDISKVSSEVKEAFAELQVPLLKGVPFFEELTINAAGRVASYSGSIGTVYAYNAGAEWAPVRELRFRGNFARAVRAPNVSETSFPVVPNFAPGFQDPCRTNNIGSGTQFRAANCATDLGALLTTPSFANLAAISLPVLSGSSPDLRAETSNSLTLGAVLQPFSGISLSADFYNIKVKDVIQSPSAQSIANSCYDLESLDNPFCALFTRYRGAATSPAGEVPGQIANLSLSQVPLNYAKLVRRGFDFEVAVRRNIFSGLRFDGRLIHSLNLKNSNYTNPSDPNFEQVNLRELGVPKHEGQFDAALTHGPLTFGYGLHYIGKMVTPLEVESYIYSNGAPPQDLDYASITRYPRVMYHSVRLEYDLKGGIFGGARSNLNLYAGVENLFDKVPPLGLQGNGERSGSTSTTQGSAIYESFGRRFFAGVRAKF